MPNCQCPACQARFQAASDGGACASCPECRFQVRVPELAGGSAAVPVKGMITCECGRCLLKFQVAEERAGTTQRCPECDQPISVAWIPKNRAGRNWTACSVWWVILAIVLTIAIADMAAVMRLKANANSAFGTIGNSIDAAGEK